jgi:hypothetical protein
MLVLNETALLDAFLKQSQKGERERIQITTRVASTMACSGSAQCGATDQARAAVVKQVHARHVQHIAQGQVYDIGRRSKSRCCRRPPPSGQHLIRKVMITGGANDTVNMNLASDWSSIGTEVSYSNHNYVAA